MTKKTNHKPPSKTSACKSSARSADTTISFPVIGIGASAGGLETLKKFFTHLPSDHGMAFVVVTHLSPTHGSILAELLTKCSSLTFLQAEEGMKVEPEHGYVIPPNRLLEISQGVLHLKEPDQSFARHHPIDHFLRTLAEDQAEDAVGIILSGTGTDGTLGVKAIKEKGGMVIVQEESSAQYSGMPASAISTGIVDLALPIEEIPSRLVQFRDRSFAALKNHTPSDHEAEGDSSPEIFTLIRRETGHDFSGYKSKTVLRRIERHMMFNNLETIADYIRFLKNNPKEITTLFQDLLIGVTNFFRDPKAFSALEEKVIQKLVTLPENSERPLRVWIAGCGTGEEAYSLAILLQEQMDKSNRSREFKIFATDINKPTIEAARAGIYPDSIAADVSPERLYTFFTKEGQTYKISARIRDSVVFALHNLIQDPPFFKLDLICCRNLLIYLNSDCQKNILGNFWYALNPEGFLFLGSSEALGASEAYFTPMDKKWKIFQRKENVLSPKIHLHPTGKFSTDLQQNSENLRPAERLNLKSLATETLLKTYSPSGVVINENYQVVHFPTSTRGFLEQPVGEPSTSILKMVRSDLKPHLLTLLHKAFSERKPVRSTGLRICQDGEDRVVNLIVDPFKEPPSARGLALVILEEKGPALPVSGREEQIGDDKENERDILIRQLEEEVKSTREQLHNFLEGAETAHEEFKFSNEELLSMNEELQSTNEELEASKEELQALNEELLSVNSEFRNKMGELEEANSDIVNLVDSTQIPTIFLDRKLRIKRFTPSMSEIFNLISSDIGRPLHHISSKLAADDLLTNATRVLVTLVPVEQMVISEDKRWYTMRIRPYRTVKDVIAGLVITFADITEIKQAEEEMRLNESRLKVLVELSQMGHAPFEKFACYVLENALLITKSDVGFIALLNEEETALTQLVRWENSDAQCRISNEPIFLPSQKASVWNEVIEKRRLLISNDNSGPDALDINIPDAPVNARRFLALPLWNGNHLAAVTIVGNKEEDYGEADSFHLNLLMEGMWLLVQRERVKEKLESARWTAEEANRAKSDFLANMSHEIRTPMTAIMGALELARDQNPNPELRMLLEMAATASDSLLLLIDDILDFSKIEAKKLAFEEKPFHPRKCLRSVLNLLNIQSQAKGVKLAGQVTPEVPALLIGDEHRLSQVLLNLIGNAIKFTRQGEIQVKVEPGPQEESNPGKSFFRFSVRDTGMGIPKAKQDKLFLSFSQGDSSNTRQFGGVGLGLAISKGIVEGMEGRIGFESEEGKGSEFFFTIPLRQAEAADVKPVPSPEDKEEKILENPSIFSGDKKACRVLVVEDEPLICQLVKIFLERQEYDVVTVSDGKEAFKVWDQGNFDLILMDIKLPGMDGYEITRAIRKSEESSGTHTPIIAMTAHTLDKDREKCLKAGMDDYISKPIDQKILSKVMKRLLKNN